MKVALVHDYLVNRGGAERVALALHRIWPDAPLYTSVFHPEQTFPEFGSAEVIVSPLQRFSKGGDDFRRLLPFFGRAFGKLHFEGYDVVIASSSGFAHHVRPRDGKLVVYCHTPPRFLWDQRYKHASVAPVWARPALPLVLRRLRRNDLRAAARAHVYIANSKRTASQIQAVYERESTIVHPPVDIARFEASPNGGDHYLMVGRLLPHRNMHLAVEAFTNLRRPLVVVGDGPLRAELEKIAGPTISFRGAVGDAELVRLYASALGVVVPEEADFGIVPLEANAAGKPVIALAKGGALETVEDGRTGVLFDKETAESLAGAVWRCEQIAFDPRALRAHAERFSEAVFAQKMRAIVDAL